jgi:hypothetical protein
MPFCAEKIILELLIYTWNVFINGGPDASQEIKSLISALKDQLIAEDLFTTSTELHLSKHTVF